MTLLGLLLECAAVAAVIATATSLVSLMATSLMTGRSAALRADAAFVAATAPALVVVVSLVAALSPSLLVALGLSASDHCPAHGHHPHLCVVHFAGLRPAAAVLGASALGFVVVRVGLVVGRHVRMARTISQLEVLVASSPAPARTPSGFPIVELPGAARVCHAVGILRRRMLVSGDAKRALTPRAWDAVRAHEDAHLLRRDPLATLVVEAALVLAPPVVAGALGAAFRRAVESACDEAAAHRLGGGLQVAEGLLEAARLLGTAPHTLTAPAATEHALEERVRGLLDLTSGTARDSKAFVAAGAFFAALVGGASLGADVVHHALETLLASFS